MSAPSQHEEQVRERLTVRVSSPEEILFDGEASLVIIPGKEGIFALLPSHTKLVSLLRMGEIVIKGAVGGPKTIPVESGIIQVNRERVEIIVTGTPPQTT